MVLRGRVLANIQIKYGETVSLKVKFKQDLYLKYLDIVVSGSAQREPLNFKNKFTPIKICNNEACDKPFTLNFDSSF